MWSPLDAPTLRRPGLSGRKDEFLAWFPDDEACRVYLEGLRWPEGFVCPTCRGTRAWWVAAGKRKCAACARRTSVTAEDLRQDAHAADDLVRRLVVRHQPEVRRERLGLQRVLALGSYETAWAMLRSAMVRPDRLAGRVEVDETFVGSVEHGGKRGRGRTRMQVVNDCAAASTAATPAGAACCSPLLEQAVVTAPLTVTRLSERDG